MTRSESPLKHTPSKMATSFMSILILKGSLSNPAVPAEPLAVWWVPREGTCLYKSDGDHEPGRGAAGVAVIVPLAVDLARQRLVGHVPDQPLREAQPRLLQQGLAAQPPVPLQDGLAETVGPFVAHLGKRERKKPWVQGKAWHSHQGGLCQFGSTRSRQAGSHHQAEL